MEPQQLKGFLAVAKHQSFSKAAKATLRTQPAVSLQVSALEDELGVTLFERLRGKTVLTKDGELLRSLATPIVEEFEGLEQRFQEIRGESSGSITLVTHNSVMRYLLPEVVREFRKEFPDTELTILNRSRTEIIKMVEEREVDLGITSLTRVPVGLEYSPVSRFNRVLIMPKTHQLARKRSITLTDIASCPLILPPKGSNTRKQVEQAFLDQELPFQVSMEIAGRDSVKEYVKMGLGVSILNEYYIPTAERKNLEVRDVSRYFGKAERGIITLKNREPSKWQARFLEILKSC